MTTMTREEAIRNYVTNLNKGELVELLQRMASYDVVWEDGTATRYKTKRVRD